MKTKDRFPTTTLVAAFVAALLQLATDRAWAYYNPQVGRWLSRDPIGEDRGNNLYGFVRNQPPNSIDRFGLETYPNGVPPPPPPDYCACILSITVRQPNADLSGTFTQWYDRTFPNTVNHARTTFSRQIGDMLQARCDSSYLSLGPSDTPSIFVNNYGGEAERVPAGAIDESQFGDHRQPDWVSTQCLGRYLISVRSFNATYMRSGCCADYRWSAEVVVVDSLGINPANVNPSDPGNPGIFYPLFTALFGSERPVVVAAWPISGSGKCCRKSRGER